MAKARKTFPTGWGHYSDHGGGERRKEEYRGVGKMAPHLRGKMGSQNVKDTKGHSEIHFHYGLDFLKTHVHLTDCLGGGLCD